ncbi:zinc finger HIT domain-containing protein 2 [Cetorhinus maximus]
MSLPPPAPEREAEACGLCSGSGPRAAARYTCPRCNVPFCSLPCYRGSRHRLCAESFYREAVLGELRAEARAGGAEGRRDLRESLRRLRDAEAQQPEPSLGLDTQGAPARRLWEALTEQQRRDFQRLLESGEAAAWIKEWRPWWERRPAGPVQELEPGGLEEDQTSERIKEPQPVVDVEGTESQNDSEQDRLSGETERATTWEHDDSIPAICRNIVPLLSLCSKPSPLIQYSVVNVLYAYAFSMKLINGDLSGEMRDEFIEATMTISEALKGNRVFMSTAEALQAGVEAVRSSPYSSNPFEAVNTIKDTCVLLSGGSGPPSGQYTLAAISHLSRTLGKAKRYRHKEDPDHFRARKKCAFLLSWVNEHQHSLMYLCLEVQKEYENTFDTLAQVEEAKSNLEKAWGGKRPPGKKVLIEELTP